MTSLVSYQFTRKSPTLREIELNVDKINAVVDAIIMCSWEIP